jgi:translation elongation factor EF-4
MRVQRLTEKQRDELVAGMVELLAASIRRVEAVDSGDELVTIDQQQLQSLARLINELVPESLK